MTQAAPKAIAVVRALDQVMRADRGRLLAGLIARLGDFQLAEDALQEASVAALRDWGQTGLPRDPLAWLLKVGLRKGIDHIRAAQRGSKNAQVLVDLTEDPKDPDVIDPFPDERLRLIFTCCHPALDEKSRIALTLRTVCNLTTREIAAGFLDAEPTMGQRISRAKAKIKSKGIGFSVPEPEIWLDRLGTVLSTLYLIFTTGYISEDAGPRDLCQEGIFLAQLLRQLHPNEPEIDAALALMLLTDARRTARIDPSGTMVPVEDQDVRLWNKDHIAQAQALLGQAIAQARPGPFQIKAALADCHMMRPEPDWLQMSLLYRSLWAFEPTQVVALNWSVVIAEAGHPRLALQKIEALQTDLHNFQPWHAARAHVLQMLGQSDKARAAYKLAIQTAPNRASANLLERRLGNL